MKSFNILHSMACLFYNFISDDTGVYALGFFV